jgi:hypothetical protein
MRSIFMSPPKLVADLPQQVLAPGAVHDTHGPAPLVGPSDHQLPKQRTGETAGAGKAEYDRSKVLSENVIAR